MANQYLQELGHFSMHGVFGVNVKVPYYLVAELAPLMAKRGSGTIINITTMVTEYGQPGLGLYSASKAAIKLLPRNQQGDLLSRLSS